MQQRFVNAFCEDFEGVIENNVAAGVKYLQILTSRPETICRQMQFQGLAGRVVVRPELVLGGKIDKLKNLPFRLAVYVDILECDEKVLEEISMLGVAVVIPLFENLQRTGEISAMFDSSPAKLVEELGFLDRDCTIVGGMYADKDDLEILGSYNAKMVICPRAFAHRGGTFANIVLMKKQGLNLQMGTLDGEIDFEKEIEFLHLTTLALLENGRAVKKNEIEKIATGENI